MKIEEYELAFEKMKEEIHRLEYVNNELKRDIARLREDAKCIAIVVGGKHLDADMRPFESYYYTLMRMKEILEGEGFKQPFTIVSDAVTKRGSVINNHIAPIGKEVFLRDGEYHVLRNDVYVNEFDFIMSKDWINDWKTVNYKSDKDYHYLRLEKDGFYVSTGSYGTLTIS